ncbi:MAG: alkaline phosphatase family protein [bacterium]
MKNNMRKVVLAVFFIAAAIASNIFCVNAEAASPKKNIIIISWDGVQRNHLNELLKDGKLPNLAALRDEGKLIPIDITTHTTDTKAGHTQMLTGYKPDVTGVYNNGRYAAIPEGMTVFERLENGFGKDNIVTLALTGKSHHIGSLPAGKRREGKQKKLKIRPAEPWNNAKAHLDVWDGDKQRDAAEVGPFALEYVRKYAAEPFFFFLHFSDPDHNGHKHGENSKEYSDAIITCDKWLGGLREKLAAHGIADKTLIYVTADHGFDEGLRTHKNAPYVWLATNDKGITAAAGDQMDITPTLLKREGLDPVAIQPPLPGKPLY